MARRWADPTRWAWSPKANSSSSPDKAPTIPNSKNSFAEMNDVYARYFPDDRPVRTTVGCTLLGIDVEIDAVALLRP